MIDEDLSGELRCRCLFLQFYNVRSSLYAHVWGGFKVVNF